MPKTTEKVKELLSLFDIPT